jgi:membrane associated rhomboid family serine protease
MRKWTLTKWIIIINCLIALGSLLLGPANPDNWIKNTFPLSLPSFLHGEIWRVVSSSWVHADLLGLESLHLVFNMMSLAMLGQIVEESLGRKHFCLIYFPAGLLSVVFYLVEMLIRVEVLGQTEYLFKSLVGASGCVMGLAAAFAVMHPDRRIMILPWPFPIRAITAILVFCGLSLVLIFTPYLNFVAHSAHLGGAIWGFIYMGLIGWYRKSEKKDLLFQEEAV